MNIHKISLASALFPIIVLILLLTFNVSIYGDEALGGSNQLILLIGGTVAGIIGHKNNVSYNLMLKKIAENIASVTSPIIILLFVGALAGTWLLSGIIPAMIYYGIQIARPGLFLPACVLICTLISLVSGSSWSTSATIGIALVGIGKALGLPASMVAGAVISGAYFGDKLSPLSDTTNLAPAMAGGDLFNHIKYMIYTTLPSIIITLIVFVILGLNFSTGGEVDTSSLKKAITEKFNINLWLILVPISVIFMIIKKTPPLVALFFGTILGAIFALFFQTPLISQLEGTSSLEFKSAYKCIINSITGQINIETSNPLLNQLFTSGGMKGMLGTIWLIICAMVFGGMMDSIGALKVISNSLIKWAKSNFQLVASTVASCLVVNLSASDQYLSIVVPGKMFKKTFKDRKLAPENLSRTLEDSGTATSALIPWNTCGAYQSSVLGVEVLDYFIYAIFNWLSPIITLIFAYFEIKISKLKKS